MNREYNIPVNHKTNIKVIILPQGRSQTFLYGGGWVGGGVKLVKFWTFCDNLASALDLAIFGVWGVR